MNGLTLTIKMIGSVQFSCSTVSDSLRPHGLQHIRLPCPSPALELAQTHVHRVGDAIQPSHPLLFPSPPTLILSPIRVFSNELAIPIRWPKYWNFSINPSNEYSGLIFTALKSTRISTLSQGLRIER